MKKEIPIVRIFGKLIDTVGENWVFDVFVTDKNLDTFKIEWQTEKGVDTTDEGVKKQIQVKFLLHRDEFEKVDGVN